MDAIVSFASNATPPAPPHPPPATRCGKELCNECQLCDPDLMQCVERPCFPFSKHAVSSKCHCPVLSEEPLIAVGAVVLCLVLLLFVVAVWHWRHGCCSDLRGTSAMTQEHTENLLQAERGE